jgi:hypothetical protein
MQLKETLYTTSLRRMRDARAKARKARIASLSVAAARRGCGQHSCPYCIRARTFSRNLPDFAAVAESIAVVAENAAAEAAEPVPWTYYDTAASDSPVLRWDYDKARRDADFAVIETWDAGMADSDSWFWSSLAEGVGVRWEMVDGTAWTHSEAVYYDDYSWEC